MVEQPFCAHEISRFRRSWVDHQRCTAILVGSSMLLAFFLPHSGHDEEDYIATLETVRSIMNEGRKMGAVDVLIRGDINIELKLETLPRGPPGARQYLLVWNVWT